MEQCKKADSFEHLPNKQLLIMKVKILQRSVYYKTAELEIEVDENDFQDYLRVNNVPKGAPLQEDYMSDYLIDNEDLWVDEIDHKINESEFILGFGIDWITWTDKDQDSEWRYECDELKIKGHL